MKKQLAILATIALAGVFANAAEDKGTEFKFGGEVMQRFISTQDANLQSGSNATQTSSWLSRNQFHVNAISSDKLQAYFDFIHTAVWGAANQVPTNSYPYGAGAGGAGPGNSATTNPGIANTLQVSEAWLWWKVSDMFSVRSGRQGLEYGDGLVFSRNEWLATPYNADGIMGRLSWDFLDLDFGGGVLADVGPSVPVSATQTSPALAGNTDTQVVFYGAYASIKTLPDFFKKAEIFALQTNFDAGLPATTFTPSYAAGGGSLGLTSIGIHLKGDVSAIDYRLDGVYQTGIQRAGVTNPQALTFNANMIDAQVGYGFPEFMKAHVFAAYHRDSGNDSSDPTQIHQYQPLFYDRHAYGSELNAVGFGNLTYFRLGVDVSPMEDTTFGLRVDFLSRTTTTVNSNGVVAGTQWLAASEGNMFGSAPGNTTGSNSNLGTEIALVADHSYGHGFTMNGSISYWSVGNYYQTSTVSNGTPLQFIANAKYAF
jgi:hypothetical protein